MADLAAILLATTIFWAYVEFCQFLIIWEANLKAEIPWYLIRMDAAHGRRPSSSPSRSGFSFPSLRCCRIRASAARGVVIAVCLLILFSRVAYTGGWCCPSFAEAGPFWLDAGGNSGARRLMLLLLLLVAAHLAARPGRSARCRPWKAHHG